MIPTTKAKQVAPTPSTHNPQSRAARASFSGLTGLNAAQKKTGPPTAAVIKRNVAFGV